MEDNKEKVKRGGKRPNSGRKENQEETTRATFTIKVRVLEKAKREIKELIKKLEERKE